MSKARTNMVMAAGVGLFLWTMGCGDSTPQVTAQDPTPEPARLVEPQVKYKMFPSAAAAMMEILGGANPPPAVVAFGEFHQTQGTAGTMSALERFSTDILPMISPRTGQLVVETWVNEGNCGKTEEKVHQDLDETTQRPQTTETEVVKMMRLAREQGVQPNILTMKCDDYARLTPDGGEVDYWEFLSLITERLSGKAAELSRSQVKMEDRPMVAIYGGAIHNDQQPYEDLKPYSFAARLGEATGGRYLEVDLYVPEFIAENEQLQQEAWYPVFEKNVSTQKVMLVERAPNSFIIVFQKGVRSAPAVEPAGSAKAGDAH